MIVSMWMTREVVTVPSNTPVIDAAELMSAKHIRRLPVMEAHPGGAQIVGIVSSSDILHAFPPEVNPFAVLAPTVSGKPVTVEQHHDRPSANHRT
jgi:CBS domain-containing protein